MSVEILDCWPPYSEEFIRTVADLGTLALGHASCEQIAWRLSRMPDPSCFLAMSAGHPVGFKIGYAHSERTYYSWLGGVHTEYRRLGIGSLLIARQHEWVKARGYTVIETTSDHNNLAMAQLNLRHGFIICGTRAKAARTQLLYSKQLLSMQATMKGSPERHPAPTLIIIDRVAQEGDKSNREGAYNHIVQL